MGFDEEGTHAFGRHLGCLNEGAVRGVGIGPPTYGLGADGSFWDVFIDYLFSHVPIKDPHGDVDVPPRSRNLYTGD